MPFMQPSGAIKLSEMQARFGGSSPASMSEYYRGGAYVKDEKGGGFTRDPVSGYKYSWQVPRYAFSYQGGNTYGTWNRTVAGFDWQVSGTVTEHLHTDGWTYRRGIKQGEFDYSIYRTMEVPPTPINQHVPESGTISMADWYNAEYGV